MEKLFNVIALIWRVPGFLFSLLFYRVTRYFIKRSVGGKIDMALKAGQEMDWVAYSEVLKLPGAIRYLMCTTSRWNPHAPVGMFGPFEVKSHVDIRLESIIRSADAWIVTIYRGDFEIVKILYPGNTDPAEWVRVNLPPNKYTVLVRYYEHKGDTYFASIKADDVILVEERNAGNEYQKGHEFFANNVIDRKGVFYFFTQYYIYQLLRWQKVLPKKLVKRLYIPVGDPQITSYRYGPLEEGTQLEIQFDKSLLQKARVYVTYCNRWGFPSYWESVNESGYKSRIANEDLVYLVRVVTYTAESGVDIEQYNFDCYCQIAR